jgi:hypothetical protein
VAVVFATLATTLAGRPATRHPLAWLLALAVGLTWGTNAAGGHFVLPSVALDLAALGWAVRHRRDRGVLVALVGAGGLAGAALAGIFG